MLLSLLVQLNAPTICLLMRDCLFNAKQNATSRIRRLNDGRIGDAFET